MRQKLKNWYKESVLFHRFFLTVVVSGLITVAAFFVFPPLIAVLAGFALFAFLLLIPPRLAMLVTIGGHVHALFDKNEYILPAQLYIQARFVT